MDLGLTGKVALVTGSSRGIGRGVALTLAEEGCDVMLTGRDEAALREVVGEIEKRGRRCAFAAADLRADGAAAALVETVRGRFGRLDILVNNAGSTRVIPHADLAALDGHRGVVRHVLRLERRDRDAAAMQPPAQSRGEHALPGI